MINIKCFRIRRRLSALLDEELNPSWKVKVKIHLASCQACQQEWGDLQKSVQMVSQLSRLTPSSTLWYRVERTIRNKELSKGEVVRKQLPHWWHKPVTLLVGGGLILLIVGFILGNIWLGNVWRQPSTGIETYLDEHCFSSMSPLSRDQVINVFLTRTSLWK